MTIFNGIIKRFNLRTVKYHKNCHTIIKDAFCPLCNRDMQRNEFGREYYGYLLLKTPEKEIPTKCRETALETILAKMGISVRMDVRDRLKGLGPQTTPTWLDDWLRIKKAVEQAVENYYIKPSRMIGLSGIQESESKAFVVDKVVSISERSASETQRFVEGSQSELLSVTRGLLYDHKETWNLEGNEPVVFYTKTVNGVRLAIGIRAVAETRGKAYHVFMDVNGRRQYPAKPVLVGGRAHKRAWVYRAYHTEKWKHNLTKKLKHLVDLEERAAQTENSTKKTKAMLFQFY